MKSFESCVRTDPYHRDRDDLFPSAIPKSAPEDAAIEAWSPNVGQTTTSAGSLRTRSLAKPGQTSATTGLAGRPSDERPFACLIDVD
jgi:hypothetical protein